MASGTQDAKDALSAAAAAMPKDDKPLLLLITANIADPAAVHIPALAASPTAAAGAPARRGRKPGTGARGPGSRGGRVAGRGRGRGATIAADHPPTADPGAVPASPGTMPEAAAVAPDGAHAPEEHQPEAMPVAAEGGVPVEGGLPVAVGPPAEGPPMVAVPPPEMPGAVPVPAQLELGAGFNMAQLSALQAHLQAMPPGSAGIPNAQVLQARAALPPAPPLFKMLACPQSRFLLE